jgi:THO complex subunit 7
MAAIRADQEAQGRYLHSQRTSLISIISDLGSLRPMSKDTEVEPSQPGTPNPDEAQSEVAVSRSSPAIAVVIEGSEKEEGEEAEEGEAEEERMRQEDGQSSDVVPLTTNLNPKAHVFVPSPNSAHVIQFRRIIRSQFNATGSAPPSIGPHDSQSKTDDDIEMGELAEEREPLRVKKKLRREELEEGEASDESSELSDPPDD